MDGPAFTVGAYGSTFRIDADGNSSIEPPCNAGAPMVGTPCSFRADHSGPHSWQVASYDPELFRLGREQRDGAD
jgi:hypothetical protein